MKPASHSRLRMFAHVVRLLALSFAFAMPCWAQEPAFPEVGSDTNLQITVGKSMILRSPQAVKRVSVANPEIAGFVLLSPYEIFITGKAKGSTDLTLWYSPGGTAVYNINVSFDIVTLKQSLHGILPYEQDLRVMAARDSIVLSGRVSSTQSLSQVLDLARGFAPEDKIRNLLEVTGIHQVMLELRVSEISKSLLNRLGVNMMYSNGGSFGIGLPGKLADLAVPGQQTVPVDDIRHPALAVSQAVDAIFRIQSGSATWTGLIDALREEGLVKVLAEPTLITLSGQEAKFLVGGEYPIPVPQGLGAVAIDYKEYGVRLRFTPTVLSENKISLKVAPEVSELDFSTAIQISGYVVPGLTTRKADTVIELADGQTFVIAGLLRDSVRDIVSKYPFLGDIPVLGNLFRSRSFQKNETELVIIATPHLVTPLEKQNPSMPTDFYVEPNEIDYYIWGAQEGTRKVEAPRVKVQVDGEVGHAVPQLQ